MTPSTVTTSSESDPINLNVFGSNQSALYQAVSRGEASGQESSPVNSPGEAGAIFIVPGDGSY